MDDFPFLAVPNWVGFVGTPITPKGAIILMTRQEVRSRIEEIGILPGIRLTKEDDALYAAETVYHAGIKIAEVTMTVPGAISVIRRLTQSFPDMIVGAGTVLDKETAARCLDAGPVCHQYRSHS
jgi:2-keto-3-deoxy-6-phosphogluconate aldolase